MTLPERSHRPAGQRRGRVQRPVLGRPLPQPGFAGHDAGLGWDWHGLRRPEPHPGWHGDEPVRLRLHVHPAAAADAAGPAQDAAVPEPAADPAAPRQPEWRAFVGVPGSGGSAVTAAPRLRRVTDGAALQRPGPDPRLPDASRRLLERLGIQSQQWLECLRHYPRRFFAMVGAVHSIDVYCARTDRDHAKGRAWAARAFRSAA